MKKTVGGPSSASVRDMLASRKAMLARAMTEFDSRSAALKAASAALNDAAAALA